MGGHFGETIMESLPLNTRIRIESDVGTVRFVGEVTGYAGVWIGVEWDDPQRGKHDGTINGIKYFNATQLTSASMIRPEKITKFESLREAIENRYNVEPSDDPIFQELQKQVKASIFEFVGLDQISKRQSNLEQLKTAAVSNSSVSYAGDLTPLKQITYLDLTSSLISTWRTVADIVQQLPNLTNMNLSQNRLQSPSEMEIVDLEPCFLQLKTINLSKCDLKTWENVLHLAKLWPHIENLSVRENGITKYFMPEDKRIFKNLQHLDLEQNSIDDFDEIVKLENINTLISLNLNNNKLEYIQLPDCEPDEHLNIFNSLIDVNLMNNPIKHQLTAFNELDKLPALHTLLFTIDKEVGFDNTFSNVVAFMSQLKTVNKMKIDDVQRRGAEYDLWKAYGREWVNANDIDKVEFSKRCRAYPRLVKKYGSPSDLIAPPPKTSSLITINIQTPTKTIKKRVPRKITVQTLQGVVIKLLNGNQNTVPTLSYIDATKSDIKVKMDNLSRSLDFYSIQDGDIVVVDWE